MQNSSAPRVWLEISLDAIRRNFYNVKKRVAPLKVMAVLKADAYGLGIAQVAPALLDAGAEAIGVAELREALEVAHLNVPIYILGAILPEEIPLVVEHGITAPVADFNTAQLLSAEASRQGKIQPCSFLLDTGMGRLGMVENQYEEIIRCLQLPNLDFKGLYSHFPHAFGDKEFSLNQLDQFVSLKKQLEEAGFHFEDYHLANSDGINNIPQSCAQPFTMVRTGINLYGVHELSGEVPYNLEAAVEMKSRLVAVRELPPGFTVGYERLFTVPKRLRVGTVSAGYADGVPLALSNRGYVIIRGVMCPIIGRVSMDYITVSLESLPEAAVGDVVTCLGKSENYEVKVEQWAQMMGTSPYNIICGFGNRVVRRYID